MDQVRPAGRAAAAGQATLVPRQGMPPRNGRRDVVRCAHMLCPEPATALLLFDARVTTAWLVDLEGEAWRGLPMCRAHADRFRPPLGWALSDQRSRTDPKRSGAEASPVPQPMASDAEPVGDPTPDDPAPTPLLSRAFRTTAQASI